VQEKPRYRTHQRKRGKEKECVGVGERVRKKKKKRRKGEEGMVVLFVDPKKNKKKMIFSS
jgi:hypothetical protein